MNQGAFESYATSHTEPWRLYCATVHDRLNEMTRAIEVDVNIGGFQQSRDGLDMLKPLIHARQHPITLLFDIVDGLRHEISLTEDPIERAVLFRDMWLTELEASNPMRLGNIVSMRYVEGKRGNKKDKVNLYRLEDGSWNLKYEIGELKNGCWRGRYNLPLNPAIWKDTEEYIYVHRPLLAGADQCDFVLRPNPCYLKTLHGSEGSEAVRCSMNPSNISSRFKIYSHQFITGCSGFGLHGCRHIVATEWIKNHPGAYAIAAVVLHDSEEMVKTTYNWCEPKDVAVFWQSYLQELLRAEKIGSR